MKTNNYDVAALAAEVASLPTNSAGHRRYPAALRRPILAAQSEYVANGGCTRNFAKQLGVHATTLAYWSEAKPKRKKSSRVRAVRVAPEPTIALPPVAAVIILPGGARIEGLTTRELIAIARGGA